MAADQIIAFRDDEFDYLQSLLADYLGGAGPCHCGGDLDCQTCDATRRLLRKFAPVPGIGATRKAVHA